ncbi:MGH1-like glycoside hydrolase domain-containing protein [Shimia abyssi]|uniref:Mannosylglycerate hydrolase MGH1-like glycoside hydrolase domain-containing protein n=1 Tax=Shimia abyssi TaxID=1662395 RepID=A0A2P8F964_9RHOB|nr:hypothetical protein [Shimia abyssi]PSL18259.1 hypothetical protein CLV88_1113 [Shimia abyssi]
MTTTDVVTQRAIDVLKANDRGGYTIPTDGLYPYQWNWDSAISALGIAEFDLERAWQEIETLMSGQWASGMVPQILFHNPATGYFPGPETWRCDGPVPSSGISQPPVAVTAARLIWEKNPAQGRDRLNALVPKLRAWIDWYMAWRLDDQGAIFTVHPWESGRDNAPDWDKAMARIDTSGVESYTRQDTKHVNSAHRPTQKDYDLYVWLLQIGRSAQWDDAEIARINPFRVSDPLMTFITLRAVRDFLHISNELGHDTTSLNQYIETLEQGVQTLWNPDISAFDSRDTSSGEFSGSISCGSYLCWYAGVDHPGMRAQLQNALAVSKYPIASYNLNGEAFDPHRYWRGPTWPCMNLLIGLGLAERNVPEEPELRARIRELLATQGFSEYFNPIDGDPAGGKSFSWTAATWLYWARHDT